MGRSKGLKRKNINKILFWLTLERWVFYKVMSYFFFSSLPDKCRTKHSNLLFLSFFLLNACAEPVKVNSSNRKAEVDPPTVGESTLVQYEQATTSLVDHALLSLANTAQAIFYCFQNNDLNCTRSKAGGEVRTKLGKAPVLIQGFELAIGADKKKYSSIEIENATVTFAYLTINTSSGKSSYSRRHKRTLYGSGSCDPNGPNSVGLAEPNLGEERPLTGLFLYEEGAIDSGGNLNPAFLSSGRVYYSGIVPMNSVNDASFLFEYVPRDNFESADFGMTQPFNSAAPLIGQAGFNDLTTINGNLARLKPFSLDQAYVDSHSGSTFIGTNNQDIWSEFVIVAFCIQGTKTLKNGRQLPLFVRSETSTQRPSMRLK